MAPFHQRFRQKRRDKRTVEQRPVQQDSGLRLPGKSSDESGGSALVANSQGPLGTADAWRLLDTQLIPSIPGNERLAMARVAEAARAFHLPERRLDQLGTAVAEATMNAMEHGNQYNPEMPVTLQILSSERAIAVRISDQGSNNSPAPAQEEYEVPDIEAKLAELQSPRGWGLFLIQHMVDEMHVLRDGETHTIELILYLEGNSQDHQNA